MWILFSDAEVCLFTQTKAEKTEFPLTIGAESGKVSREQPGNVCRLLSELTYVVAGGKCSNGRGMKLNVEGRDQTRQRVRISRTTLAADPSKNGCVLEAIAAERQWDWTDMRRGTLESAFP